MDIFENNDMVSKLKGFFQAWKVFQENELLKKRNMQPAASDFLILSQMKSFFNQYEEARKPIIEERRQGKKANVWKAANLGRNEVRNSRVLKWMLDASEDHGQESEIFKLFLSCSPELFPFLELVVESLEQQPLTYAYRTTEECCPLSNKQERVDIEIESEKFLLFIEVKIDATEGNWQLQRYCEIAKAKAGNDRKWAVIYLTIDGSLPKNYHQDDGRIITLSWKRVAKAFKSYKTQNYGAWLVHQFADHIESFY